MRRLPVTIGIVSLLASLTACSGASSSASTAPSAVMAPQINVQPASLAVLVGQAATLTVQATGTGSLTCISGIGTDSRLPALRLPRSRSPLRNGRTAAPVSGASFSVSWSAVDKGPSANPQYDWTSVDNAINPWINAGRKVYLTVWGSGYGTGTATLAPTLAYVQSQVSIINCTGSSPAYWQPGYYRNYQAFMAALIQRYGSSSSS